MKPHSNILRQESDMSPSSSTGSPATLRKPRVLLIAEAANPALTSAALVAWSCSKAIIEWNPAIP